MDHQTTKKNEKRLLILFFKAKDPVFVVVVDGFSPTHNGPFYRMYAYKIYVCVCVMDATHCVDWYIGYMCHCLCLTTRTGLLAISLPPYEIRKVFFYFFVISIVSILYYILI
jgi:hypothetical protein